MNKNYYIPRLNSVRGIVFIAATMLALAIGLALVAPAHGAPVSEDTKGDISGTALVDGAPVAGIAVELRQRTNAGQDATISTTQTDGTGTYHFPNQPSAPNDAFYYIRFGSGKGTLAAWYSFPIIYVMGSQVSVPGIDFGDVQLVRPVQNASVNLPAKLEWNMRRMGETYRVFVYALGKNEKPVLDSGSLGTGTEFTIGEGALPAGHYEAVVQVRDAVAGYGQSQSHYRFTVDGATQGSGQATPSQQGQVPGNGTTDPGAGQPAAQATAAPAPAQEQTQNSEAKPQTGTEDSAPSQQPQGETPKGDTPKGDTSSPDVRLNLSADKSEVSAGENITYKVEAENAGSGKASGVVVVDKLPEGMGVDAAGVKAGSGTVLVEGGTVTVNLGDLEPGAKVVIEIPAKVSPGMDKNVSNQASATFQGAGNPVRSNAHIAEVSAPVSGTGTSEPQQATTESQAPTSEQAPAESQAPAQAQAPVQPQPSMGSQAQPPAQAQAPSSSGSAPAPAPSSGSGASVVPPKEGNSSVATGPSATQPKATQPKASQVPHTGGSFPVWLALALVGVTLLARYLRGLTYRRA